MVCDLEYTSQNEFKYDATGNRIVKIVKPNNSNSVKVTTYHRDAQGNILATEEINNTFTTTEYNLYGSSRLGVFKTYQQGINYTGIGDYYMTKADKYYEITNHLGNVMAVVSDRKTYNTTTQRYEPIVASAQDYLPFGMLMPGRQYPNTTLSEKYRYGFNGMERDDEIFDNDVAYKTLHRIYDARLGRWLSVDPLAMQLPWQSPYVGMDNKPIIRNDEGGDCPTCFMGAVISALLDATFQVGEHMLQGTDFGSALGKVNWVNVSLSGAGGFVSGAFSGGAGKIAAVMSDPKKRKILEFVIQQGGDYIIGLIEQEIGREIDRGKLYINVFNKTGLDLGLASLTPHEIGKAGEKVTREILDRAYSSDKGFKVLEQVRGKFDDGTSTIFDYVVMDSEGNVVQTLETKANKGRLTGKQKQYVSGDNVELQLEGHKQNADKRFKNSVINKTTVDHKMHNVGIDRKSGRKTTSTFKKLK